MFISMQNVNFITQFFLEILQRYCILVILSTLGMPSCTHQKLQYQFIENCDIHCSMLIQLHPSHFVNMLVWVIQASLFIPPKFKVINLQDSLMFICMQKVIFTPFFFLRCCKDITNLLFQIHWACLTMNSKNDTTSLQKTLIFIFMPKIIFIPPLFLEILQKN